jgi:hypothetical protein
VVIDAVCTFVMLSGVGGDVVLLALLTKPEQPLRSAAAQLRITALAAHTRPLTFVLTFVIFSRLWSALSWDGGWGPWNSCFELPELRTKDKQEALL